MNAIADVQNTPDVRNIPINQVGIKGLTLPVAIRSLTGIQHTVATMMLTVGLPAHQKGTHMSRFVALMESQTQPLDFTVLSVITKQMVTMLEAKNGEISITFPFFRKKSAPISGIQSTLDYQVTLRGIIHDEQYQQILSLVVPVTSLCPCSKEISTYGAHNQRSHVSITIQSSVQINIEEIIDLVESQASCQLYGLLKRPDEKFVTEYAYDNPKFVEDIVRDIAMQLQNDVRIESFSVESENFESIHNHSAYAKIQYP